jgi:AbrB family looped-hinge helix DNA binding protein
MGTIRISQNYGFLIPREVRESLRLRPGDELQVFAYPDRIEFAPVRKIRGKRGFLKGIDTTLRRSE